MARVGLIRQAMEQQENVSGMSRKKRRTIYVRWMCPMEGWLRLNMDGASKGNPGAAGAGGIIRGHRGELFEMYAVNCGICSCTKEKLLAVLRGLAIAWNAGHIRVQLTVDSEVVAHTLIERANTSSPYYYIVNKCQEMISKPDWEIKIYHCYREANRAADWLANYGVGLARKMVLLQAASVGLHAILLEDLCGMTLARRVPAVAA